MKRLLIGSFLVFCMGIAGFLLFPAHLDTQMHNTEVPPYEASEGVEIVTESIELWQPVVPDMARMKSQGCVADGLLSGYNKPEVDIPLARASACYYFHRALETWLAPPDFAQAEKILEELDRPDAVYGMFIAEAIDTKATYRYRGSGRDFDFSEMCRSKSKNFWGEHTCKPSLKKEEYQLYLRQITRDAMDVGIRVFLFGQIEHQEDNFRFPKVDNVIEEMRDYAQSQGITIYIGAQTGEITNKKYLAFFDYIDGGVGLWPDGHVEAGPCFTKYWKREGDWCWPLMWHEEYTERADNVFVYLDWNGQQDDDMHIFASMPASLRHRTLEKLHTTMSDLGIGFFMPLITPLPRDNDGNCHGPRKRFYSPSMEHDCKDIDAINALLAP